MTALWTRTAADPPEALLLHRSEPEARAVLEDWYLTAGCRLVIYGPQMRIAGYGYGGGGGDGDGDGDGYGAIEQEDPVDERLSLVVLGGGYYPYVLVGWVRRVAGDEYDVVGARCVRRFGTSAALAGLAAHGPKRGDGGTELLEAAAKPERIHRLLVRRCIPCDEAAWAKDCPKPEGWPT